MKKRIIIYINIIGALILVGGVTAAVYYYQSNKTTNNPTQTEKKVTKTNEVTYKGKDGVTALALLEQNAKVITSGTGEMAFVTTIDGVTANPKSEFWAFYVDGKTATVGAGSYVTKSSETITWKLSKF